ncbi:hypothetical protein ADK94_32940 [Streptomyces sp. XY593]|nr:hypothetical protein ADK49_30335 [Streptomyces sp. WM6349]KOU79004.1 hypothetical protein ADK94_32940 [Streptomyces sp. XY593]KOU95942.1 hypothetical protein ADK92_18585 [Streptomyces sp. XY533]KOU97053.1 hypothetical protein ADK91_33845 [Streptomyces sp. XY511]KOV40477.1 hypothetical protein ADK98_29710 [Streptomyces sp. H036]
MDARRNGNPWFNARPGADPAPGRRSGLWFTACTRTRTRTGGGPLPAAHFLRVPDDTHDAKAAPRGGLPRSTTSASAARAAPPLTEGRSAHGTQPP